MLSLILEEIESNQGPLNLKEITRKLGIEQSALDGMIQLLVRTGRLKDIDFGNDIDDGCGCGSCNTVCPPSTHAYLTSMRLQAN